MNKITSDVNSVHSKLVSIKDGIINIFDDLKPHYGSSQFECQLYRTLNILKDMAQRYYDENQKLKAENARLSGRAQKPKLKPSVIASSDKSYQASKRKRTQVKNPKKSTLEVSQSHIIKVTELPRGCRFKGYKDYYVQELEIKARHIRYRRERWQTPEGQTLLGQLPESIKGNHFGTQLRQFILYQYYHNHVTQPLLLNQLRELGISISSGQLSNLLIKNKLTWHNEKERLLACALQTSAYIQVDDTGARHQGKNGYCTQLGNEQFAYFSTSPSKSKTNFLSLLQKHHCGYRLNQAAVDYLSSRKQFSNFDLMNVKIELAINGALTYTSQNEFLNYLRCQPFNRSSDKLLLEAAMIGYLSEVVFPPNLVILSDEAKQFDVGRNAACWVHAERKLTQVLPNQDKQSHQKQKKLACFWQLYQSFKEELVEPKFSSQRKWQLRKRFDNLCQPVEQFESLNKALNHLLSMKDTLLKCLEQPLVPLHNNLSESDIREYVKRRKLSGCTKSDDGRDAIDTFLSLKKTCQRHQISFWAYLKDRIENLEKIPDLSQFIIK